MNKLSIVLSFLMFFNTSAKVLNFETTRMKSTAGAGSASLVMNEASFLNPAPIAFFNVSSLYVEKSSTEYKESETRSVESSNYAFIASDAKNNLRGSIALVKHDEGENSLEQFNVSLASVLTKKSSLGVAYRNIKKSYKYNGRTINEDYKIVVPGVFHAVNKEFSIGFSVVDPARNSPNETKAVVGLQYNLLNFMIIMMDLGADYEENISDTGSIRGATQLRVFDDFFLRFGAFEDKKLKERGSGFGVGWVQPKLVVNFAIKNTRITEDTILKQENEDIKESSFSLSYRF